MQLEDWLDDLCVRFIINLPPEELESVERICFQVEEAQWFYEDFIRVIDPSLPSLPLRNFSLRIFQHCPVFSHWSADSYQTAFAEFLAYKQRVPVRGAIMLNEAMDEVVLVKGWKKGANWSFPRGKINKDESDLDCAVREVYEETGFDIRAAGLVKDEKEMKAIDITMREQHMKLFVFRGVPKDIHFEPRTRKEISKIEWYKLTDLPTVKKHKHQDSSGGVAPAINANKFYMVAPFLGPLKKWIGLQKKKGNRYSSHLAAPPITADESEVEYEPMQPETAEAQYVSDLPEVTLSRVSDPTSHLKEILNIRSFPAQQSVNPISQQTHMPAVDTAKSNALLNLLRGHPAAELRATPSTPLEQLTFPAQAPRLPHQSHTRSPPVNLMQSPSQFNIQPEISNFPTPNAHMQNASNFLQKTQAAQSEPFNAPGYQIAQLQPMPRLAPYQRTGDPQFARQQLLGSQQSAVPPASALPKLTSHAKSLLDVFKGKAPAALPASADPTPGQSQSLLALFKGTTQPAGAPLATPAAARNDIVKSTVTNPDQATQNIKNSPNESKGAWPSAGTTIHRAKEAHQTSLLDLFSQQGPSTASAINPSAPTRPPEAPAELAANHPAADRAESGKQEALLALLRQKKTTATGPLAKATQSRSTVREGETAATINGPLNQPDFDAIPWTTRDMTNGMGRSPLSTHRKLFDPKQPANMKILARPEEQRQAIGKSARPIKEKGATSSPKRVAHQSPKETIKPFQPQILRRPQTAEEASGPSPTEQLASSQTTTEQAVFANSTPLSRNTSSERESVPQERISSQADAHKQTLLSLFGGSALGSQRTSQPQTPSRVVSPLSTSQIISPVTEVPVSAIEPISTRSRMGSLTSVGSGVPPARPAIEKRQTGAENKAFLLGYLGRIATQER